MVIKSMLKEADDAAMPIIGTTRGPLNAQGGLRPPRTQGDNVTDGTDCQRLPTEYRHSKWNGFAVCELDSTAHYVQYGRPSQWQESIPKQYLRIAHLVYSQGE